MESKDSGRKSAKGRGINADAARKTREDRTIQLRKEKRFDRANIERRKVIHSFSST
jgi:IS5 family transposase